MNDAPTPETDAQFKLYSEGDIERSNPLVSADFARKLEMERNELRLRIDNLEASTIHSCHDQCQRPACKARRERDEAREDARWLYECLSRVSDLLDYEKKALRLHEELVARED